MLPEADLAVNASPSWSTLLDFLDQPAVAIRIAERDETAVVGPSGIEARGAVLPIRSETARSRRLRDRRAQPAWPRCQTRSGTFTDNVPLFKRIGAIQD